MSNMPKAKDSAAPLAADDSHVASESVKAVAVYEIIKGLGALTAAGALWLWHIDLTKGLERLAHTWQQHFGSLLAPQVESISKSAEQASVHWIYFLFLILAYAALRFIEAYGLWHDKVWAYWFCVIGYGVFIPIELYYLIAHSFDWFKVGVLLLNITVVTVVYRNMKQKGLL